MYIWDVPIVIWVWCFARTLRGNSFCKAVAVLWIWFFSRPNRGHNGPPLKSQAVVKGSEDAGSVVWCCMKFFLTRYEKLVIGDSTFPNGPTQRWQVTYNLAMAWVSWVFDSVEAHRLIERSWLFKYCMLSRNRGNAWWQPRMRFVLDFWSRSDTLTCKAKGRSLHCPVEKKNEKTPENLAPTCLETQTTSSMRCSM